MIYQNCCIGAHKCDHCRVMEGDPMV